MPVLEFKNRNKSRVVFDNRSLCFLSKKGLSQSGYLPVLGKTKKRSKDQALLEFDNQ